jgi:hypothetical protein
MWLLTKLIKEELIMAYVILTQELLKENLHYNPETGIFIRAKCTGGVKRGAIAGSLGSGGYVNIKLFAISQKAHRLAWLYIYGYLPKFQIDHINGIKTDNRLINLREATPNENGQNIKLYKCNTSGFIGVSFHKIILKYQSRITICNKTIHLGYFKTAEEAHKVYVNAKSEIHTFNPVLRES